MIKGTNHATGKSMEIQRRKGAMLMVYFRWLFIAVVAALLIMQYISGYRGETRHAIFLMGLYLVTNIFLWLSIRKRFDPQWIGYFSALIDAFIVSFHLFYLTSNFDPTAATAAATTFLFPVLFILYTFRIDYKLLLFLIIISISAFNLVYFFHYFQNPEFYQSPLSLTPVSHLFKSTYILFIGFLCIYFQLSIKGVIVKEVEITRKQAEAENKVRIEQEKGKHSRLMVLQTEEQNRKLAKEIQAKEQIAEDLANSREELERINKNLEQTITERTEELTRANTRLIKLEKENLQSQFDVLKQQVNPHFLFNSLNVLSSLIRINSEMAESFTERLAKVYRYVLENKDKDLIPLTTELDFLEAYLFLIRIRFEDKVNVITEINCNNEECFVVPLAIQLLIENAIKHNAFSRKKPLTIRIFNEGGLLTVENNLQIRETNVVSTGVGLANISKRYSLLTDKPTQFEKTESLFIAKIPLLDKNSLRS